MPWARLWSPIWRILAVVAAIYVAGITFPHSLPVGLGLAGAIGVHRAALRSERFRALGVTAGFCLGCAVGFMICCALNGWPWFTIDAVIVSVSLGYGSSLAFLGIHHARQTFS